MTEKPQNFCKIAFAGQGTVLGRVVRSTAGRDCGRLMLIVGIEDEAHVLLADGRLRTLHRPKKKKLRHLQVMPDCSEELRAKLLAGADIQDAELRGCIAGFVEKYGENGQKGGIACLNRM